MTRLLALAAIVWLFICVPFFVVGHEFLDPSGEYSAQRQFWVAAVQWIALFGPPLVLWAGSAFLMARRQ